MTFLLASSIVILIANLFLGLFVYFGNRRSRLHQCYLLLILSISIWIMGIILIPLIGIKYRNWLILAGKIPFLGGSLVAGFFLYFSQLFPKKSISFSKIINLFAIVLIIGMVLMSLFTDLALRDVLILNHREYRPEYGSLYPFWAIIFLLYFGNGLAILIRKYRKAQGIEKLQIKYFFIGTAMSAAVAITTNLLFPLFGVPISLRQYGPLALIFSMVFTTYGITKHHLMNLKIVATELLVGMMLVILLIDVLMAKTLVAILFKVAILIIFGYLGISLIRSVLQEIERREKIEKMSEQLKKAYRELKKLDVAKSEFIAMASHQLRTPLSIIKGYVSMLIEGSYGEPPQRFKKPLKGVFDSSQRLLRIINDLLDISKVELGKIEVVKEKTQVEDLIDMAVKELKPEAEKKRIELKWERPEKSLPKIKIDPLKIGQVIECVVDNAIKYTKQGKVIVKCQMSNSRYQIIVKDTGVGMGKDEKEKIFESFIRGTAGIDLWVQGTGLGLYLAKKYVELHNGRIWAESSGKNKGSTFYIELPKK